MTMIRGGQEAIIIETTCPNLGFNNSYKRIGNPILQRMANKILVIGRPSKNRKENMS